MPVIKLKRKTSLIDNNMDLEETLKIFDDLKEKSINMYERMTKNKDVYNTSLLTESLELADKFEAHIDLIVKNFPDYYKSNQKYLDSLITALKVAKKESATAMKKVLN